MDQIRPKFNRRTNGLRGTSIPAIRCLGFVVTKAFQFPRTISGKRNSPIVGLTATHGINRRSPRKCHSPPVYRFTTVTQIRFDPLNSTPCPTIRNQPRGDVSPAGWNLLKQSTLLQRQEQPAGCFQKSDDIIEKSCGGTAVNQAVIIGQAEGHHQSHNNFVVDDHRHFPCTTN